MGSSNSRKKRTDRGQTCRHCRSGAETFRFKHLGQRFRFDVSLARKMVLDNRTPVEVDEESIRLELEDTRIHKEHLLHVDTKYPGIISHVWFPMNSHEEVHGHLLIDGNHRAARCLELGIPYFAYILTEEESREILLEGPTLPDRQPVQVNQSIELVSHDLVNC